MVRAQGTDGKIYVTEGAEHGKVPWDCYRIEGSGVQVDAKGQVSLDSDPRAYAQHPPRLHISLRSQPGRSVDLELPVRYDLPFALDVSGTPGVAGMTGTLGLSGMEGIPGSNDPQNPMAGGDGGPGQPGGDGNDGRPGGDGPDVSVWVTQVPDPRGLLQVKVQAGPLVRHFLVDPRGGSLSLNCNGGRGGDAGLGGRGGAGGPGGSGSPSGATGTSGIDGFDGRAGSGGRGGAILVHVDPAATPFMGVLHFSNRGGSSGAGRGGIQGLDGAAPHILIGTVPPLW